MKSLAAGLQILKSIFKPSSADGPGHSTGNKAGGQSRDNSFKKAGRSRNKLPDQLVITEEFQQAFDLMENTRNCAYITGKAGTGKSTLLNYFRQKTRKNCVMLAPMGIAAIKVEGATINSFFHFPPKIIDNRNIFPDRKRQELFKRLEMIIIDEVSMVRADIIDGIDYSLRINRQNNAPFGGVQMIFFGDLYQLAPVIVGNGLKQYFERHYGGVYFFNARVFTKLDFQYLELQIIFRQKDEQFKNILNSVRENKISASELAVLNKQYQPGHTYEENDLHLTLTATNKVMESINRERMENQPGKEYRFQAIITGNMDPSSYPTDPVLVLKQGAQIMLLKNDSKKRWVNGSLGRISQISNSAIWVEINGSSYFLERANWEVIEYAYNSKEKKIDAVVKGSFSQFPIQAAWAMTIHKSQGQTFNSIVIDLGNGAVSHGQTYVALSRCTSLEKIILKSPIRKRDIILDENVKQFIHSKTGNKKAR